jgi:hypothetical protein
LHPHLNPKYNQISNPSRFIILNFRNQHSPIDFPHHIFSDIFEISTFSKEPKHTFDLLASTNERFHIFQGPLEVRKHFFEFFLTHQLHLEGRKVFLKPQHELLFYGYHHMQL